MKLFLVSSVLAGASPTDSPWYRFIDNNHQGDDVASKRELIDQERQRQDKWVFRGKPLAANFSMPVAGGQGGAFITRWPARCHKRAHEGLGRFLDTIPPGTRRDYHAIQKLHESAGLGGNGPELFATCCFPKARGAMAAWGNFFNAREPVHYTAQLCWDMHRPKEAFNDYAFCCHPVLQLLISSDPPSWLYAELQDELGQWHSQLPVDKKVMDHAESLDEPATRCRIRISKSGIFTCSGEQWGTKGWWPEAIQIHWVIRSLDVALALKGWDNLPTLDLFVSGRYWEGNSSLVPVLTTSYPMHAHGLLRVPRFCLNDVDKFVTETLMPLFSQRPDLMMWSSKLDRIVWRGAVSVSQTNCSCDLKSASSFPPTPQCTCNHDRTMAGDGQHTLCSHIRCHAVRMSLDNPEDFDFRLSGNPDGSPLPPTFDDNVWFDHMPLSQMLSHKYVLDIEGQYMSTMRPYWLLLSRCLIFRQTSRLQIFLYRAALRPFVHYIPVREDLSDLSEKLRWARNNPEACQQMVENAWEFGRQYVSKEYGMYTLFVMAKEMARLISSSKVN